MFEKDKFKVTKTDNVVSVEYEDKDIFRKNFPVPKKQIKELVEYQNSYLEEAANLAAQFAKENFKKDKNVDKLLLEVPYAFKGKGNATYTVHKEKEYRDTLHSDGKVFRKSAMTLNVKDPAAKLTKSKIGELVDDLTATFCK